MMLDHPGAAKELVLQLSVKAMNYKLGPEGHVPSALVFGEYPKIYTLSETPKTRPNLAARAEIALTARRAVEKHMSDLRVKRAMKHAVPSAAD